MRSLANQTDDELGGPLSVLVRQKRDHERLEELLQRLEAAPPHEQPVVLRKLYRLVFPQRSPRKPCSGPPCARRCRTATSSAASPAASNGWGCSGRGAPGDPPTSSEVT